MGIKNNLTNMKLSVAFLAAIAQADEKKVPPRHPLQRLNRLVQFSAELLDDWYGFLPSQEKWKKKFATNAARMEKNFQRGNQRCGYYDEDNLPHGGPPESEDQSRTMISDTTVTTLLPEQNKSLLVSVSGPSGTSLSVRARRTTATKSTE